MGIWATVKPSLWLEDFSSEEGFFTQSDPVLLREAQERQELLRQHFAPQLGENLAWQLSLPAASQSLNGITTLAPSYCPTFILRHHQSFWWRLQVESETLVCRNVWINENEWRQRWAGPDVFHCSPFLSAPHWTGTDRFTTTREARFERWAVKAANTVLPLTISSLRSSIGMNTFINIFMSWIGQIN